MDIEVKANQFLESTGAYPTKVLLGKETFREFNLRPILKDVKRIDLGGGSNGTGHSGITRVWLFGGCLDVVKTKHKRYFRVL